MADKKSESILDDNPFVRGFWTDSEMLIAVGAKSMAFPRDLVRHKIAEPGRFTSPSGQHARAWSFSDLVRIRAAIEFVEETGFSQAAACVILRGVGRSIIDLALAIRPTEGLLDERRLVLAKVSAREKKSLMKRWAAIPISVYRSSPVDVLIENRRYISVFGPDASDKRRYRKWGIGTLLDGRSKSPTMVVDWKELEHPNSYLERSQLTVHLHTLCSQFTSDVTGFEVSWEISRTQ